MSEFLFGIGVVFVIGVEDGIASEVFGEVQLFFNAIALTTHLCLSERKRATVNAQVSLSRMESTMVFPYSMRAARIFFMAAIAACSLTAAAQETPPVAAQHVFRLKPFESKPWPYQWPYETRGKLINLYIILPERGYPSAYNIAYGFKKQPEYMGPYVVRSALPMGNGSDMGFAWDRKARTLYLDLNRNGDLTDDPGGVVKGEGWGGSAACEGIRLTIGEGEDAVTYIVTMFFSCPWDRTRCQVRAEVRSGWAADVELDGRLYRITAIDDMDGVFGGKDDLVTLEPVGWRDHPRDGSISYEIHGQKEYRFFYHEREYTVSFARKGGTLDAIVTTTNPVLGEMDLPGTNITYLVLSGPALAVLENPGPRVTLPVGKYRAEYVELEAGDRVLTSSYFGRSMEVDIQEGAPAMLTVGGPVRNVLSTRRSCNTLQIWFDIAGIGGEQYYECVRPTRSTPRFVAYQDELAFGAGTFEYWNNKISDRLRSYTWRVPLADGELKLVAFRDLGSLGPAEGVPLYVQWDFLWSLFPMVPYAVVAVFLRLNLKRGRTAWLLLAPVIVVVVVAAVNRGLVLLSLPVVPLPFLDMLPLLWLGLSFVWLLAPWLRSSRRKEAFWSAWKSMLLIGAIGLFFGLGLDFSTSALWSACYCGLRYAFWSFVLAAATVLVGALDLKPKTRGINQ